MQAFGMRFLRLGSGRSRTAGFRRLIIRKENDMATPYKECPHCGAHLDYGEKCECRAEEIETVLIIRTKPSNDAKIAPSQKKPIEREDKRQ